MKNYLIAALFLSLVGCSSAKKAEEPLPPMAKSENVPAKNLTDGNVFDAGTFSEKEDVSDVKIRGGHMFDSIPAEKFYSIDREKLVPVGKLFYVVTEDEPARCIPAKFTVLDGKKRLVVYSKSTVPITYCIYQKTAAADPAGFAVSIKNGGVCMPAIVASKLENGRTISTVEFFSKVVSFNYCFNDTFSYGLGRGSKMYVEATSAEPKKKKKVEAPTPTPGAPAEEPTVVN